MAYQQVENYSDPKNQYLYILADMVGKMAWALIDSEDSAKKILASLFVLIQIEKGEKDLLELQHQYVINYNNLPSINSNQVRQHIFSVTRYMNKTYFKGWSIARPKYGSEGSLGAKNP